MIKIHVNMHFAYLKQDVYRGYNGIEICRSGSTSARGHQSFSPFTRKGQTMESFISAHDASRLDSGNFKSKGGLKLNGFFTYGAEDFTLKQIASTE